MQTNEREALRDTGRLMILRGPGPFVVARLSSRQNGNFPKSHLGEIPGGAA